MGHLKDIANQPNQQTFPESTFSIVGDVPASQCSEAKIEGDNAVVSFIPNNFLYEPAKFTGFNLAGKVCTITINPVGPTGDYDINFNTPDVLALQQNPGDGKPVSYYVHDGGTLILTRDAASFAEYITTHALYQQSQTGQVVNGSNLLTDPGKFPFDLANSYANLLHFGPPEGGPKLILSNTLDVLTLDFTSAVTNPNVPYIIRPPEPWAYTIKGGTLHTNIPANRLQNACTILFDPLT